MDISLLPYRPDRDVYRLLGVPPNAGRVEIVAACRRLARAFHPDRNVSQRATEEMQVVNAVRSLLTDPDSRAEYDEERLSFLQATIRPRPAEPPPLASAARAAAPALARTARAAMAGMLAALRSLTPVNCQACDAPIEPDYRFCGACGAPT
ncbi:MAG: DnaJ domain-containing protein [Chloroflexota bacterium]|nr:DnaJ domain-containing protein [Chloroflexota bacterium]